MCGIIGVVQKRGRVAPFLHQALKRLEYRGYDSVGMTTIHAGQLYIKKDKGKIEEVHRKHDLDDMPGSIGIGHTRWATHGIPSLYNSHPHFDCKNTIAVVHNGVIDNFIELRRELVNKGHQFSSETDTEVIPHMIEDLMDKGMSLHQALRDVIKRLRGTYAIVAMTTREPQQIVCTRDGNPLVIGRGEDATYVSSDIPSFLPVTNKMILLLDGEIATLTEDDIVIVNLKDGTIVQREPIVISWTASQAQKGGFPHFMLKEIYEQPDAIRNTLHLSEEILKNAAHLIADARHVYMVAMGTSGHAAMAGRYMFSSLAGILPFFEIASDFQDTLCDTISKNDCIIAITQSGETTDTLMAVKYAKRYGANVIAITNVMGSSVTRIADQTLVTYAGPEIGVAATKTFMAQLTALARLALATGVITGVRSADILTAKSSALYRIPDLVSETITRNEEPARRLASIYSQKKSMFFLGRGISIATAYEGALKVKEVSYTHAEGYSAGESKHGPIALVEKEYPVIFIAPKDETRDRIIGNIMEMKARGGNITLVIERGDEDLKNLADHTFEIPPGIESEYSPMAYVVPIQILSYYMATSKGCDPDKPRNLAKSVTVL